MITAVIYLLVFLIVFPFLVVGVGVTIFVARQRYKKHAAALQAVLPTNAERPSQLHPVDLERLAVYVYQRLGYRNVTHTWRALLHRWRRRRVDALAKRTP